MIALDAEAQLDAALSRIERIGVDDTEVDFGILNWDDASSRLAALFQLAFDRLAHYAWVETRIENRALARTVVSWKGDFTMFWTPALDADHVKTQLNSLAAALRFRAKLILTLAAAARAAASISVALASPVTALIALRSISKLVSELQGLVDLAAS